MEKINVGIIGCGAIGNALIRWLNENNQNCNILKYDPPKNLYDDIKKSDIIFISIHILTDDNYQQDLTLLENLIQMCPNVPIFIRTTIKPGTTEMLSKKFNKDINFMPEFLTERTAYSDFCNQKMIFTNHINLLKEIFINKDYVVMNSKEAEVAKYVHNVFGALKVTFFNGIYEFCKDINIDYKNVIQGALLSGYINSPHTQVPGPDGQFGYGGKCFPKDVLAFIDCTKNLNINNLIKIIPELNAIYRNKSYISEENYVKNFSNSTCL